MTQTNDELAIETFRATLTEAQRWCATKESASVNRANDHVDPALRTLRLSPYPFASDYREVVHSVVGARWNALGLPSREAGEPPSLHGGRILYFEPAMNLMDGAACVASLGFFDTENVPPWDTWLCFADNRFLVSWVPPGYVKRVAEGIWANPEQCINWAEAVDAPFTSALRHMGVL